MKKNILAVWIKFTFLYYLCESFELKEQERIELSRGVQWPKGKKLFGPGYGWDFLTGDVSGYPLINITFYDGITTNDERFLVPDCFVVQDRKLVNFYDTCDVIESSSDYNEVTSKSVSASASLSVGFGPFKMSSSGSFSQNFKDMMSEQKQSKTITLRTQYFDHRYTLMINSDCRLNGGFESFILEIAGCLKNNDIEWAAYLAQELVRDYGTHYIKKASLGGLYYKDDYVSSDYWFKSENQYSDMKLQASMSFRAGFFGGAGGGYGQNEMQSQSLTQEYQRNTKITKAQAIGGSYKPGDKVEDWAPTIDDNLAIIDKEVDIISSLITYYNFQNIERIYLSKTRHLVEESIKEYFTKNTIRGCLNRRSVNFHPYSNIHDRKMCNEDYIFGSYYEIKQECQYQCQEVSTLKVNNFLTKDVTCPYGYTPIVHKFEIKNIEIFTLTECRGVSGFEKSPVLFGGIYSNSTNIEDNPVTGNQSCPLGFTSYSFLNENANICLSRSVNDTNSYAVPFMGFLSTCDPQEIENLVCPDSYDRYYVASYNRCFLYYCTRIVTYTPMPISKPPYNFMPQRNYRSLPND